MRVQITISTGKVIDLEIETTDTVLAVKQQISKKEKIPLDSMVKSFIF